MPLPWNVIGVPCDCIGAPPGAPRFGTELSPAALRQRHLVDRLGAVDLGDLDVRISGPDRDPATGIVGGESVHHLTRETRRAVAEALTDGGRVFLLGGCCTPVMGALAGARDVRETVGLVYVDGHLDLDDNLTSPGGEAADMPVAAVLGVGEAGLLAALEPGPVVPATYVSLLGARDPEEPAHMGHLVERFALAPVGPDDIASDPAAAAWDSIARSASAPGGYWIHLDLDVLGEDEFPATDVLMPGGLDLPTLQALLAPLGADDRLVGFSLGCYNPEKDPEGMYGSALVDLLAEVLAR